MERVAEFIKETYPESSKIVEVGVGRNTTVARLLNPCFNLVVTDVELRDFEDLNFVRDDITNPSLSVYEGASLIYSVRPPYELHDDLLKVARKVGADLLIVPLGNEESSLDYELVNYEGKVMYLIRTNGDNYI
ncbi:MAG: UPF0146 family protein [Halobacteria archaeon]|nr:UPF0146 family protein [Halobacteria archaeon]